MNIFACLEAASAKMRRVRDDIRHGIATAAILCLGAVFIACAAGFLIAAAFMWLNDRMSDPLAALCVAGGLAFAGLLVLAVAGARRRPSTTAQARPTEPGEPDEQVRQVQELAALATDEVLVHVRKSPATATMTALALGVVVGLLRSKNAD